MYIPLEIQQIWSMHRQAYSCIADRLLARLDKLGCGNLRKFIIWLWVCGPWRRGIWWKMPTFRKNSASS